MKKIQEVLKNKSGQGVPMILAVVLCCLILACVTFEYMRLMIVAQGVRVWGCADNKRVILYTPHRP